VVTAGAVGAAVKAIGSLLDLGERYRKNKPGLVLLAEDLKKGMSKISHRGKRLATWPYRVIIKEPDVIDVEVREIAAASTETPSPSNKPRKSRKRADPPASNDASQETPSK
jgi:hypothetical protein